MATNLWKSNTRWKNPRFWIYLSISIWVVIQVALVFWWAFFLNLQNNEIWNLRAQLSFSDPQILDSKPIASSRMIWSEALAFISLILTTGVFVFWLMWREVKRAKALQIFFASFAHELRTPLASLRLQSEYIADSLKAGKNIRIESVHRILEDSARLEFQVERSLELARFEAGAQLQKKWLRLRPLLESIRQEWLDRYPHKNRIILECEDVDLFLDPVAFQTAVRNILENMHKHAQTSQELTMAIRVKKWNQYVEILFQDNGQGFSGDIRRLGSLFYRGKQSSGSGVGLYLVKSLCESMGAKVIFDGLPSFSVKLLFPEVLRQNS